VQANSDAAPHGRLAVILLVAVSLGALGSLAAILEARQRGEVLDLVEVSGRFAPATGEKARIEWRQRVDSSDATVLVIDRDDATTRTLLDRGALAGDDRRQVFRWDGRTDQGELAPPGRYRVEILLSDLEDRDIVPERSAITLYEPPGDG
jgi:hypothetical protein